MNPQIELNMDFAMNPKKYLSYEKFVKVAIKDYRPEGATQGLLNCAVQGFPSCKKGQSMVFKGDGVHIHKKLADRYVLVSPLVLEAYGKTPIEFWEDWNKLH